MAYFFTGMWYTFRVALTLELYLDEIHKESGLLDFIFALLQTSVESCLRSRI